MVRRYEPYPKGKSFSLFLRRIEGGKAIFPLDTAPIRGENDFPFFYGALFVDMSCVWGGRLVAGDGGRFWEGGL